MINEYLKALELRRTNYSITPNTPVNDDRIVELVEHAVKHIPSAFNSQTARVAILFGEQHKKLWNLTLETLRGVVPPDAFAQTEEKINNFAKGYATVLYFYDASITEQLMQAFPLYAQHFPVWAQHENGMLQHAVWTSLALEGLGASLQHYNPLIDDAVREAFGIPQQWKLIAQMPFGTPGAPPAEKEYQALGQRVLTLR